MHWWERLTAGAGRPSASIAVFRLFQFRIPSATTVSAREHKSRRHRNAAAFSRAGRSGQRARDSSFAARFVDCRWGDAGR